MAFGRALEGQGTVGVEPVSMKMRFASRVWPVTSTRLGRSETRATSNQLGLAGAINTLFPTGTARHHALILSHENGFHIHSRKLRANSPASGVAGVVCNLGTRDHGLGRSAPGIYAGATQLSDSMRATCSPRVQAIGPSGFPPCPEPIINASYWNVSVATKLPLQSANIQHTVPI